MQNSFVMIINVKMLVVCLVIGSGASCSERERWDDQARIEKSAKQEFMGNLQGQGYSEEQAWKEWQRQRSVKQTMGYRAGSDVRE